MPSRYGRRCAAGCRVTHHVLPPGAELRPHHSTSAGWASAFAVAGGSTGLGVDREPAEGGRRMDFAVAGETIMAAAGTVAAWHGSCRCCRTPTGVLVGGALIVRPPTGSCGRYVRVRRGGSCRSGRGRGRPTTSGYVDGQRMGSGIRFSRRPGVRDGVRTVEWAVSVTSTTARSPSACGGGRKSRVPRHVTGCAGRRRGTGTIPRWVEHRSALRGLLRSARFRGRNVRGVRRVPGRRTRGACRSTP